MFDDWLCRTHRVVVFLVVFGKRADEGVMLTHVCVGGMGRSGRVIVGISLLARCLLGGFQN